MKIALLLSNHFREFAEIQDYIKNFFSNVDIFASTWDHDFENFTKSEYNSLKGDMSKREFRLSGKGYHSLDLEKVKRSFKDINVKKYSITTKEDYFYWLLNIKNSSTTSKNQAFTQYGEVFSKYNAFKLINFKEYDYIFSTRFDIIPDSLNKFHDIVKNIKDGTLYTEHLRIVKGLPHIGNWIMYGKSEVFQEYYCNLEERLDYLLSNPIIKEREKERFYFNNITGSLLLGTNLRWKLSEIYPVRYTKDTEKIFSLKSNNTSIIGSAYIPDPHDV
tara:strand:- start:87 stop:911 length:825 start_codon:yes stop_codon:yes gene_type:complete